MTEDRLSDLAVLAIEREITKHLDLDAGADLGLNFWGGTDDVGEVISGCGQLSLHGFFLRSQNFEA